MALKSCPTCKETLAVACKTCTKCGYIFQAKKQKKKAFVVGVRAERSQKAEEDKFMHHEVVSQTSSHATGSNKEILTSKRDLDVGKEKECESSLEKNVEKEKDPTSQPQSAVSELSSSKIEATSPVKKRGRPKGSKDKRKRLAKRHKQVKVIQKAESLLKTDEMSKSRDGKNISKSNATNENESDLRYNRKRGRPRGSRKKSTLSPMFYAEDNYDDYDDEDFENEGRESPKVQQGIYIPPEKEEKFSLILEEINERITGQNFKA